jgi:uncharacterized membrane protein YvbJ
MIICPECGEENPQGSKFCRKCGINLTFEEAKKETTAKKVTVETDYNQNNTVKTRPANTNSSSDDDNKWCWGCCIAVFFLFIIFAIVGH